MRKIKSKVEGVIQSKAVSYELSVFTPLVLRETATNAMGDNADKIYSYFKGNVENQPSFDPMKENLVVYFLNTRQRIIGHQIVSVGMLNEVTIHAREIFRTAIVMAAHTIVLSHNHPSGDPMPSDADIKGTKELIRAGRILKIELIDHIVTGENKRVSLREMGYFHN